MHHTPFARRELSAFLDQQRYNNQHERYYYPEASDPNTVLRWMR